MPLITYDRTRSLGSEFQNLRTENGIVSTKTSPILSQIIDIFETQAGTLLSSIYDLETELDISRCSENFLAIWGKILNEPRGTVGYATELGLSNVRISLSPSGTTAGDVMLDGGAMPLSRGILLYGSSSTARVRTIDNTVIAANMDGVYVRVVSESAGTVSIAAGSITSVEIPPSGISGVDATQVKGVTFSVTQSSPISGGSAPMSVDVYRYVLLKKAESMGLVNATRLQTLMKLPDVVSVAIVEHAGGACVFLDVKLPEIAELVTSVARVLVRGIEAVGKSITVHPAIYRRIAWTVKSSIYTDQNENDAKADIKTAICAILNNIEMGGSYSPIDVLSEAVASLSSVRSLANVRHYFNGRLFESGTIQLQRNEKIAATIADITVL